MVHVGLDEAGAGPVFGSLWAAAAHVPDDVLAHLPSEIRDSKALTERKREAAKEVVERLCAYGLGEVTQQEIDDWNDMGRVRRTVFHRALDDFCARHPHLVPTQLTVDGTLFAPWRGVPHVCVPKADATVPCVSAASILAKTTRDAQVLRWCEDEPALKERYALHKNKGYLSAAHLEGLRAYGRTARHRATFRIRALE